MSRFLQVLLLITLIWSISAVGQIDVKVDLTQKSEPISPYIYGQFIEHLGKCIYGGIWAEMLEDRKFYYPVTDEYKPWETARDDYWNAGDYQFIAASPWQVIGPAGTVKMETEKPFVGAHTPVITLPGDGSAVGIAQPLLALVKGIKYEGRIVLAGQTSAAPIEVRLVSDGQVLTQTVKSITADFQTYLLNFAAKSSSDNVALEIISKGSGSFKIGTVSLMPADNLNGWRKDVVALLKELNAPVYRWPGGNFVSGYNWRDGIGPRDVRPPRKNPAWKGIEHNDVGIHEYMELMDMLKADAFIAVNTGLGTVEEVAEEVEYINGAATTPLGKLRAQNGHPAPYAVKWWAVGNEMYGNWQLGHIPLEEYVKKHNRVAEAMWKVDPSLKLIGVGEVGDWSKTMLSVCGDYMNLLSEHIYCKEKPEVVAHTRQLAEQIKTKAEAHRKYRQEIAGLAAKDIRIAMDEWNFWYGDYIYGELGVQYHLKDALGVVIGLHEFYRNSDLYFMANYAQTVNVIGCIKTSRTDACFATTGLPLKLYRAEFGSIPVALTGETGDVDVFAALTADGKALTLSVVNPTTTLQEIRLGINGAALRNSGVSWTIGHADPEAFNEPGKKPKVEIVAGKATLANGTIKAPALSVVLYRFGLK